MTKPRRVGLNALFLDPGVSGGSETYVRNLVPAMLRARPGVHFEVVVTRRGAAALAGESWAEAVRLIRLPCDDDEPVRRTLIEHVVLPQLARRRGWDLLHSLANRAPRRAATISVVTVHDVIFFHHRTMGWVSTYGMRWAVRAAVAGADALIAASEAAADDVARTLRIDRSRITAVPHGPGSLPGTPGPVDGLRERYGLAGARVVLCVAAKRPHKNQSVLIKALPHLPPDVHVVLVGHDEGYGADLAAAASNLGVAPRVHLLEGVSHQELEALWVMAGCAAFPTRAEGFGMPVLEAMRRSVPVVCSDIPVLREVAGEAARFFDPSDPGAAAAAIDAALRDPDAAAAGPSRAELFSWTRTAEETLAVYERALASKR